MTKPEIILSAGKRIAAIASGRAPKDETSETSADKGVESEKPAEPANPDQVDRDDARPGQGQN